jgi:hypothetical protein
MTSQINLCKSYIVLRLWSDLAAKTDSATSSWCRWEPAYSDNRQSQCRDAIARKCSQARALREVLVLWTVVTVLK